MRKNVVIFGASRAGKTTLAHMIARRLRGYQVLCGDAIRDAFMETLPDTNITNHGGTGMKGDFQRFLPRMLALHAHHARGELHYVLETCDVSHTRHTRCSHHATP